jgi:hypothetical protein
MNTLKFARELAQFEEHLDWLIANGGGGYRSLESALAASYKALIEGLVELDGHLDSADLSAGVPRIPNILAQAIAVFREREDASTQSWKNQLQSEEAEYAEAVRRHELALAVGCPYCGAQSGAACRTAGPSGTGQLKGVHDHKDRYRAATDPEWKRAASQLIRPESL